jgi:hypothetical protein
MTYVFMFRVGSLWDDYSLGDFAFKRSLLVLREEVLNFFRFFLTGNTLQYSLRMIAQCLGIVERHPSIHLSAREMTRHTTGLEDRLDIPGKIQLTFVDLLCDSIHHNRVYLILHPCVRPGLPMLGTPVGAER